LYKKNLVYSHVAEILPLSRFEKYRYSTYLKENTRRSAASPFKKKLTETPEKINVGYCTNKIEIR
jgi:hypothetical protein